MPQAPKLYISAALAHLRHGVTASALVIVGAAIIQLLIFGCVHFTQIRYTEPRREAGSQPLSVVSTQRHVAGERQPAPAQSMGPAIQPTHGSDPEPGAAVVLPRGISDWDASLHVVSDMAATAGTVATIFLAVFSVLGVVVAGGACIPGVDRAVSAAGYAMLLFLGCVPWRDVFWSLPYPGVFTGYGTMVEMSQNVDAGGPSADLFTMFLFMPLAAMAGAFFVLARFRAGVADGIIVTSASELDERLEREIAAIRARGVAATAPRSVAALNQAIGDKPTDPEPAPEAAPAPQAPAARHPAATPAPRVGRNWLGRERRIGEPDIGDPLKRPI